MTGRRLVVVQLAVALAACLVLVALLAAAGTSPRTPWFVAVAVCAVIVVTAVRLTAAAMTRTDWPDLITGTTSRTFNSDTRVRLLSSQLRQSTRDPHAFRHMVQPSLKALVAARLERRYGIDAATDPIAAEDVAGDWLWDLITTDEPRTPTAAEITRAVEIIESL